MVNIVKNGKGIKILENFNGYIQIIKKQSPQYLPFSCGMTHKNYALKIRKNF